MDQYVSFGNWVRQQRRVLDITQAELAQKVSCSLSMLRKIERDERRPSAQLAELLADHLAIANAQRSLFLRLAAGAFVPDMPAPSSVQFSPLDVIGIKEEGAPFVGRTDELDRLHEHLDQATAGEGKILFIAGEAGRGKTSLLYEFARQALAKQPALIISGGSSDVYTGIGDPLLPFRDIFQLLVGDFENVALQGLISRELVTRLAQALPRTAEILLDRGPNLIDTLVPGATLETRLAQIYPGQQNSTELLVRLQNRRARRVEQPGQLLQQERLFDEISTTLASLARSSPLLLILDDLHWVDASTAGLLGHLIARLQQSPILLVGSYRPEDLVAGEPLSYPEQQGRHFLRDVLSESQRQFGHNRIDLDHPEAGTVMDFVNALLDDKPNILNDTFRRQFADVTDGNALFAVELLKDMKERGDVRKNKEGYWIASETLHWDQIPARVEGVIQKRVTRLPGELRQILSVASVQGESFIADVIARVKQIETRQLMRLLNSELDSRHHLVREQGVQHLGSAYLSQYRFRHHLFQQYLYEQLGTAERMYLHEDVGNAMEMLYVDHTNKHEVPAAQLAHHFEQAHLYDKASRYLLLSGRNALRVLAFEEAAAYFERGLLLLQGLASSAEIDRLQFELTLTLARAYWHSGRVSEAVTTFEKSIGLARALDDPSALARAVLAYEDLRWRLNLESEASQQYVRDALGALSDEESGLRVRLLVNLSRTLLASGERDELRASVDQALRIARHIGDPVALSDALRIFAEIDRRPETTADRLAAIEEMVATTRSIGDQERLSDALDLYVYDQLELGNIDVVDEAIATQMQVAEEIKQPFQLHVAAVFQTMRAIMRGEFVEAEHLANEAAEISRQIGLAELDGILGIHMFTIRAEQGRLDEIAPIVRFIVANNPSSASWRPGLALLYATLGLRDECRTVFENLAYDGFAFVPQDSLQVATLAYLSEVCAFLGDRARAEILYDALLPYDGRNVVVGGATACYGAAGRYLGMLATIMERWPAAETHFTGALELNARMGARPWLAHTQYEYAAMLLARGQEVDQQRAIALLADTATAAREMGMAFLLQKIANLQKQQQLA